MGRPLFNPKPHGPVAFCVRPSGPPACDVSCGPHVLVGQLAPAASRRHTAGTAQTSHDAHPHSTWCAERGSSPLGRNPVCANSTDGGIRRGAGCGPFPNALRAGSAGGSAGVFRCPAGETGRRSHATTIVVGPSPLVRKGSITFFVWAALATPLAIRWVNHRRSLRGVIGAPYMP